MKLTNHAMCSRSATLLIVVRFSKMQGCVSPGIAATGLQARKQLWCGLLAL